MKKLICTVLALTLALPVFAADNTPYAHRLNELGIFRGTDKGYELEAPLTREQAAAMLVRVLGAEREVKEEAYDAVFADIPTDRWSFPYIMYCYENEITKGTGEDAFSPMKEISAADFVTLVLRVLGFEAEPDKAFTVAVNKMLLSSKKAAELEKADSFTRNDMVYIICRALSTKTADGRFFAYSLADKGVITEKQAEEFDVYKTAHSIDDIINSCF